MAQQRMRPIAMIPISKYGDTTITAREYTHFWRKEIILSLDEIQAAFLPQRQANEHSIKGRVSTGTPASKYNSDVLGGHRGEGRESYVERLHNLEVQ